MLERIKAENSVNVYEFLYHMRSKRVLMVQTLVRRLFDLIDWLVTFCEAFIEVLNDDVLFMRSKLVVMVQTLVKRLFYLVIFLCGIRRSID